MRYCKTLQKVPKMAKPILTVKYPLDLMSLLIKEEQSNSLQSLKKRKCNKQEYIYQFGDSATEVFFIKKGRVRIENNAADARTIIKNVFGAGELFGEAALIKGNFRSDFAIAMEETELYIFSSEEIFRQMQESHPLALYLIKLLGTRLIAAERKIEGVVFKNSRARVIDFLMDLAEKRGQRIGYEVLVREFFTHQEIANLSATSRQTVTTVLNELRNKKILTFNRRRLLIRDLDLLKRQVP